MADEVRAVRKFTTPQRRELKQLVIEADIQRFSLPQSLTYIKEHLGQGISEDYFHHLRCNLKKNAGQRIAFIHKQRYAYLQLFFDRIDELRTLQKENWALYHRSKDDHTQQHSCLRELHQLTITIGNYYDALPMLMSQYASSGYAQPPTQQQQEENPSGELSEIPV